jgi:transposase-like protein
MVIEVIYCRHCSSDDLVKNGLTPNNGKQKYLSHVCGRQSRQDPSPIGYTKEERKEEILRAYQEQQRSSLRGLLRRTFGVSPTTVLGWIKKR